MNEFLNNATLLPAAVFLVVVGCCLAVGAWTHRSDRRIEARVRRACDSGLQNGKLPPQDNIPSSAPSGVLLGKGPPGDWLGEALAGAGVHHPRAKLRFWVGQGIGAVAGGVIGLAACWQIAMPRQAWILFPAAGAALGYLAPRFWLWRRRLDRERALRRSIPDFLDLVVACLSGGYSVQAALKQVSEELRIAHPLLATELSVMLREIDMGSSLDSAMRSLADRTKLEELRALRSFVHQTMKFGTTIIDGLQELAETLRLQREQRAEELAQKAAIKILIPTFLFIFPTVFVVLVGPAAIKIQQGLATTLKK